MVAESLVLEQCGQYLSVSEDALHRIGDLFGRCLVTHDDPQHGTEVRRENRSLLRKSDGSRIPNSGLFPALQFLARQHGIDLQRRITPAIMSLPEPVHLELLRFPQVAQFVSRTSLGRIAIHPGIISEIIVADLSLAFPDARIVVLGEHSRQLARVASVLRDIGIRATQISSRVPLVTMDDAEESLPQVICSTPREAASIDFATAEIVIVLDASTCSHSSMQMTLSQMDAAFRLLGLIDVTRSVAPSAEDAMMATFGPEILRLQSHGLVRRDVHVAWVPTPRPAVAHDLTDPGFGACCYWLHARRNRRIKQVAEGLRTGTPLGQQNCGDVARCYGQPGYCPPTVTILVERPIHAAALSRLLPDWPVIATNESLNGMNSRFCAAVRRSRRRWFNGSHQIVLTSAAPQFRGETTDVVIWAGGGSSIDVIPRNWFSATEQGRKPMLIIDFQDRHNSVAQQFSGERQHAYLANDMFPIGNSAAQGRLAMFLYRQPGEHQ